MRNDFWQYVRRPVTYRLEFIDTWVSLMVFLRLCGTATLDRTQFGVKYKSHSFFQNLGSYAIRNDFQVTFDRLAR
ncbi:hypothetical protein [Hymenobacter armeniacus]|uniref:hypothetical protein n=1 Tax=Hymenobacter armeniacus TaxID=2771358 RepID=UPI001686AD47|nr:hypothetical protein [Hymenobacter armeniacus]